MKRYDNTYATHMTSLRYRKRLPGQVAAILFSLAS